jgi:hypothetical protein
VGTGSSTEVPGTDIGHGAVLCARAHLASITIGRDMVHVANLHCRTIPKTCSDYIIMRQNASATLFENFESAICNEVYNLQFNTKFSIIK